MTVEAHVHGPLFVANELNDRILQPARLSQALQKGYGLKGTQACCLKVCLHHLLHHLFLTFQDFPSALTLFRFQLQHLQFSEKRSEVPIFGE